MDEDKVVKSVPVYLSTKLQEQLHLLQFPIRTTSFNEAEIKKMEVRYKPNTKYLEMDVPIPVDSPNYDKEKGKDLIKGINEGNIVLAEQTVRTEFLDCQTMSSSVIPQRAAYYAAAFKDGELHLTKIKSILQLRPNLKYLNEIDAKTRITMKKLNEEDSKKEEKGKALNIQFKKKETEEELEAMKKSFSYMQKLIDEENFVDLQYVGMDSEKADQEFNHLFSSSKVPVKLAKNDFPSYLNQVCPVKIKKK